MFKCSVYNLSVICFEACSLYKSSFLQIFYSEQSANHQRMYQKPERKLIIFEAFAVLVFPLI